MTDNPIHTLYDRLSQAGVSRHYIKQRVLPEWWDDRIARSPAGYQEALGYLSKHLGISLGNLRSYRLDAECNLPLRFKTQADVDEADLDWHKKIAVRAAEIVAHAMPEPAHEVEAADHVRKQILEDHPWVNLPSLVDYCWNSGIPVIPISHFPSGRAMDGVAMRIDGHPVIVIGKKHKHGAWLSFILAHELGHLAKNHLSEREALTDESVKLANTTGIEKEADDYAVGLLADGNRFNSQGRWPKARDLAREVLELGEEMQVDPAVIVLNFAWNEGRKTGNNLFPLANKTLNLLKSGSGESAAAVLKDRLEQNLNLSSLPEESTEFLKRITGLKE